MTALILCAALSVICAAVLALAQQDRRQAVRELTKVETTVAIDDAVTRMAADVLNSQGEYSLVREIEAGGRLITVTAENEAYKWPMEKLSEVSPVTLAHRTKRVTLDELKVLTGERVEPRLKWPVNDCFRQLVSPFGFAATDQDRPRSLSPFASSAKDGQVWRVRAVLAGQVREQLVRFTGDPVTLYAVIINNSYTLAEMPACPL